MNDPDRVAAIYRIGDPLPGALTVSQGTEIAVTLIGTQGYGWTAVESLRPEVVGVSTDAGSETDTDDDAAGASDRVTQALAVALEAGRAELRSTASFRGDRFGPRTLLWRLTIDVAPRGVTES